MHPSLLALALASTPAAAGDISPVDVARAVGARHADTLELTLVGAPGRPALASFELDGQLHWIDLQPTSVRAPGFRVIEDRGDSGAADVAPGPVLTYRGSIPSMPGTTVAASWLEGGLEARLVMPDGESVWLRPLEGLVSGAASDDYAMIHGDDLLPRGAAPLLGPFQMRHGQPLQTPYQQPAPTGDRPTIQTGSALLIAELGLDSDFEYFQAYGSVAATQAQIEAVINAVNVQFEQDCGITHEITAVLVRSTPNDPYTTNDAATFLNQFRNHWESEQQSIPRDVAQLFTGKNMSGSIIGLAFQGSICTDLGYGLVQSDCCGSFALSVDLSAHQLGHNWNADNCICPGFTMNTFLTGANQFSPTETVPDILEFASTLDCLETGPPVGGQCSNAPFGVGAAPANIGSLTSSVDASLGVTWTADLAGFAPGSAGLAIAAASQASIPFGDGVVLIAFQTPTATLPVATDGSGAGSLTIPVPNNPSLVGITAYLQAGVADATFAGGFAFSNGLAVTFCN